MPLTDLPDVSVGAPHVQAHNDERHGINDIHDEFNLVQYKTSLESDLASKVGTNGPLDAALDARYLLGASGLLAYAENKTGVGATFPTGSNWGNIVGCQILVPPTESDVYIFWKAAIGLSVAGQGQIYTGVWDVTGANDFVVSCKGWVFSRFYTNSIVGPKEAYHHGFTNIGKSDINRSFQLSGLTVQEGSSLSGYSRNTNDDYDKSWMAAVML